ncbi:coiled-coil domain-containing protein 137 [Silurus asotus]|uniref:Coiled-coil domain-containing protein 137 n=1 Tax=Silurus asotus TaxID=30991 RepID=A0AAD5B6B8_SILAS|nr:coiled-coil domain-containing protein 137 [Silurus asotus]
MGKNNRATASKVSNQQTEDLNQRKKWKKKNDVKPRPDEHLEQIPFQLRAIMKSKEKMNMGSSKLKKMMRAKKPKAQTEINEQEHIRVPHFRRGKKESEKNYLQRMSQETQRVLFLTKNQPDRRPEQNVKEKTTTTSTSNKEINKEVSKKGRCQRKKKVKKEKFVENKIFVGIHVLCLICFLSFFFKDKVQFGEVVMAPPELTVKPKKAPVKSQKASNNLLLSSMLGHTDVSTAKPSMARQRIIKEEHERVVHAYRQLKRQIMERKEQQKAGMNKLKNPE